MSDALLSTSEIRTCSGKMMPAFITLVGDSVEEKNALAHAFIAIVHTLQKGANDLDYTDKIIHFIDTIAVPELEDISPILELPAPYIEDIERYYHSISEKLKKSFSVIFSDYTDDGIVYLSLIYVALVILSLGSNLPTARAILIDLLGAYPKNDYKMMDDELSSLMIH